MTDIERQVWASTYGAVYVQEMDLGRQRGDSPTPENCARYGATACDVADSAVFALRVSYEEFALLTVADLNLASKG